MNSVSCIAPVNIACIKYCEYIVIALYMDCNNMLDKLRIRGQT